MAEQPWDSLQQDVQNEFNAMVANWAGAETKLMNLSVQPFVFRDLYFTGTEIHLASVNGSSRVIDLPLLVQKKYYNQLENLVQIGIESVTYTP